MNSETCPETHEAAQQELEQVIGRMVKLLPQIKMPRVVQGIGAGPAFDRAVAEAEAEHERNQSEYARLGKRRDYLRALLGQGTWPINSRGGPVVQVPRAPEGDDDYGKSSKRFNHNI